jgi:hypothetical protein
MKYTVNLRWKNLGPAKYLIDSKEANDLTQAYYIGDQMIENQLKVDEHFIEILDPAGDIVASFNTED